MAALKNDPLSDLIMKRIPARTKKEYRISALPTIPATDSTWTGWTAKMVAAKSDFLALSKCRRILKTKKELME